MKETEEDEDWTLIIGPKTNLLDLQLKELWSYRDLVMLFVKRDFVSFYKQTILGPLWYIIQPLLTTLTFTLVFSKIANISTAGIPPVLFYLCALTGWNYFADCLNKTSNTFINNANIFGKVYFPRMAVPVSIVISSMITFAIQFGFFMLMLLYYIFIKDANIHPHIIHIAILPLLILIMAGLGLAFGIIISSMTTKYRDLRFLVTFGVQLLMYATPVIYPLSTIHGKFRMYLMLNPMTSVIEAFRFSFLGNGYFSWSSIMYSFVFMVVTLFAGVILFNKVEKSFMDTI